MLYAVQTTYDGCDCPLVKADKPEVRRGLCGLCELAGPEVVQRYVEVWDPPPLAIPPAREQEDAP
jgi:hypothetical protein